MVPFRETSVKSSLGKSPMKRSSGFLYNFIVVWVTFHCSVGFLCLSAKLGSPSKACVLWFAPLVLPACLLYWSPLEHLSLRSKHCHWIVCLTSLAHNDCTVKRLSRSHVPLCASFKVCKCVFVCFLCLQM